MATLSGVVNRPITASLGQIADCRSPKCLCHPKLAIQPICPLNPLLGGSISYAVQPASSPHLLGLWPVRMAATYPYSSQMSSPVRTSPVHPFYNILAYSGDC